MIGMMGGCMTAMGVLGLVLALALLAGAVAVSSYLGRRAGREDRALAVLRERFARGEIDRAEYEERRTALVASEMEWA